MLVDIDFEGVNNRKNLMGSIKVMIDNVFFDGEEIIVDYILVLFGIFEFYLGFLFLKFVIKS